jgi:hypothetical protein
MPQIARRRLQCCLPVAVLALTALAAPASAATATAAAPSPAVRALQKRVTSLERSVRQLTATVKTLRTSLGALQTTAGSLQTTVGSLAPLPARVDALETGLTTAQSDAKVAVTKTNCIVNGTAYVVWSNFAFQGDDSSFFTDLGIAPSFDDAHRTGFLAGIDPACVPSVLPRFPGASPTSLVARRR